MAERTLRERDRRWLEGICNGAPGMYPGESVQHIPDSVARRLLDQGFIEPWYPHNPSHHGRWVATEEGRRAAWGDPSP